MAAISPPLNAPEPNANQFASGFRFGRFTIIEELGESHIAHVYRAREMGARREVTLKVLHPEYIKSPGLLALLRSITQRSYSKLKHINLAPLYRVGECQNSIFIARKYFNGGSAADRIAAGNPFSLAEVQHVLKDITPALNYLHQRGVVHANLKPENILFDGKGIAHLADVGMSPLMGIALQALSVSENSAAMPIFAPEQLSGKIVSRHTDQYLLAAALYMLLSGQPIYTASSQSVLFDMQAGRRLPSAHKLNPSIPISLDKVLRQALEYSAEDRFTSLDAFTSAALTHISSPVAAQQISKPQKRSLPAILPRLKSGQRFAGFIIQQEIASRPTHRVYLALERNSGTEVALKVLAQDFDRAPEFSNHFKTVVNAFARFRHKNLVSILRGGKSRGYLFYAVEYMPGGTLADRLEEDSLEPAQVVSLLRPIAPALSQLHEQNIIHQNLKPSNILFDANSIPRLSEVGIAPNLYVAASTFLDIRALGPFDFKAPEQLISSRRGSGLTARADIYALGALTYRLLAGRSALQAKTPREQYKLALTEAVPPCLGNSADDVLQMAMSFHTGGRFQSVYEFIAALSVAFPTGKAAPETTPSNGELTPQPTITPDAKRVSAKLAAYFAGTSGMLFLTSLFFVAPSPTSEIVSTAQSPIAIPQLPTSTYNSGNFVAPQIENVGGPRVAFVPQSTTSASPNFARNRVVAVADTNVIDFSEFEPAPTFEWRPPPAPVPLSLRPEDHFWLLPPIASDIGSWPNPFGRYGAGGTLTHTGLDIYANTGTPVQAAAAGIIEFSGWGLYYGRVGGYDPYGEAVVIKHDFGYNGLPMYTVYAHMSKAAVKVGERVHAAQLLGWTGSTGNTSGPHLHYEVRIGENAFESTRNPELWLSPPTGWGVLAGRVLNRSGHFIPFSKINIYAEDGGKYTVWSYGRTLANSDDAYAENFVVGDLPAGQYDVQTWLYSAKYNATIEILPGQTSFVVFQSGGPREVQVADPHHSVQPLALPSLPTAAPTAVPTTSSNS